MSDLGGSCARIGRPPASSGFTLVELMVVVAIVGILASLSSYGVRKYTAAAKSVEAVNALGSIGTAVRIAADRDNTSSDVLKLGTSSGTAAGTTTTGSTSGSSSGKGKGKGQGQGSGGATVTHGIAKGLCGSSEPVPASLNSIKGKKYQPSPSDYRSGDAKTGWRCLLFSNEQPQYYQYRYRGGGGGAVSVELPHGGNPKGLSKDHEWMATAKGDLDGDGVTSTFALQGYIDASGQVFMAPAIGSERASE